MAMPTNIKTLLSGDVVKGLRIEFKKIWDAETMMEVLGVFMYMLKKGTGCDE